MSIIEWMRGRVGGIAGPVLSQPVAAPLRERARLSLALQGGGSFGAFTWGVIDRLLEERALRFDIVSGSSAGAINAALLAAGLARGGREAAREQFERFWRRTSGAAPSASFSLAMSTTARVLSPYQFNPLDLNPLRTLLDSEIDFALLRDKRPLRLMLGATRVADGGLRVFREHEISVDVLLASACLPEMHQTIEIEGEPYWDGGYAANPPLLPLVQATAAPDVLVVQIVPSRQPGVPRSVGDIHRRLGHMTFNASLVRDLDVLETLQPRPGPVGAPPLALHKIAAEDHVDALAEQSALRLDWSFLRDLRDAGRAAAALWLAGGDAQARIVPGLPSPAAHSASSPARNVG